mmetsp:Transcript_15528/g.29288  ORF Transcript_15528/g.29288 Transcript_15528/m.29288 type:complete len:83 (+) Transcript_15528:2258-2506(+)
MTECLSRFNQMQARIEPTSTILCNNTYGDEISKDHAIVHKGTNKILHHLLKKVSLPSDLPRSRLDSNNPSKSLRVALGRKQN